MRRLFASIYKEFLVLIRDRAGLAILFIMPLVLILIMTIIQDATFKTVKEVDISMILVNNDKDSLGEAISQGLYESEFFNIVEESFSFTSLYNGSGKTNFISSAKSNKNDIWSFSFLKIFVIPLNSLDSLYDG